MIRNLSIKRDLKSCPYCHFLLKNKYLKKCTKHENLLIYFTYNYKDTSKINTITYWYFEDDNKQLKYKQLQYIII